MSEPRRSSRQNKGTHLGRDLLDVYYRPETEEPAPKKQKLDEDFSPPPTTEGDPTTDENLAPEAQEGDVRCDPCGTTQENYNEDTDEGGTMIECDDCATWQHAACMGYKTKRQIPENYKCNRCEGREGGGLPKAEVSDHKPVVKETKKTQKEVKLKVSPKVAFVNKTRASVTTALLNVLLKAHGAQLQEWALKLEEALYGFALSTDKKYIDKSRSVMALIKKPHVFQRIEKGEISPRDVVVLPPEEIDFELRDYAEKVRQELIRRSVLTVEDELSQRIRRTHKGEEIVETTLNDDEMNIQIAARNIDHRVFKETTPVREVVQQNGPNLYQIGDDDDEEKPEDVKDGENGETSSNSKADDKADSGTDSDDELDFILGSKSPEKEPAKPAKPVAAPAPKLPPTMSSKFWLGEINFPDFVDFQAKAEFVGCTNYVAPKDVTTASFHNKAIRVCKELLEKPKYSIEGRLDRARADPYVGKITSSRDLYVVKITSDNSGSFEKLFGYLLSRQKVGVLSGRAACVKDAYLYAIDTEVPKFMQLGPITRGLYAVFVVKKDYVPVGKSILKKALPPQPSRSPQPAPTLSLDLILSKLAETPAQNLHAPQPQVPLSLPNVPSFTQGNQLPLELTQDQLQYLSELVSQNPHVQHNPQALLSLIQGNQVPGYH